MPNLRIVPRPNGRHTSVFGLALEAEAASRLREQLFSTLEQAAFDHSIPHGDLTRITLAVHDTAPNDLTRLWLIEAELRAFLGWGY